MGEVREAMKNSTLEYYDQNAEQFFKTTADVDFTGTQDRFLRYLEPGSRILDLGCGSGRDTRYFLEKGYQVDATDGSAEICRLASEHTGIPVKQMLFSELDAVSEYDGIWACASILHLPEEELRDVMHRIGTALKEDGVFYTSFKYGDFAGERNGRYFRDFTEESFREFLTDFHEFRMTDQWITSDVRPNRGEERWLNVLLRRTR